MIKPGKKTKAWNNTRANLKKDFLRMGITRCEVNYYGCTNDWNLSFAHVDKRRYLESGELSAVVLSCIHCHNILERMPHLEMRAIIQNIINNRNK